MRNVQFFPVLTLYRPIYLAMYVHDHILYD